MFVSGWSPYFFPRTPVGGGENRGVARQVSIVARRLTALPSLLAIGNDCVPKITKQFSIKLQSPFW